MKTKELIEELRQFDNWDEVPAVVVRTGTEAADRLEAITKAWEDLETHMVGRADSRYLRDNDASRAATAMLQRAITGE